MTVQLQHRLFTVDEIEQMVESGILTEDDRVELIEGQVITMSPPGSRHAACVNRLNTLLAGRIASRAIVSIQNPINLSMRSQPEPDIALLRPRSDFYAEGHPAPEDVLLVVEVADSSLNYDQETKLPLYAAANIGEVWIVSVENGWIDCYRHATPTGYRLRERFFPGDVIQPDAFTDIEIAVNFVLGLA